MPGQEEHEIEFQRRQRDWAAFILNRPRAPADPQMIEAQRVAVLRNRSRPPQYHFYSGRKFPRAERLGDVIVRAHLETDQLVDLISAGRKHDDRRSGKRADAPAAL